MKRIAVFTSGGDAQGMNAALRAVVRSGLERGLEVFAIYEGYSGMVEGGGRIKPMRWGDVGGILHQIRDGENGFLVSSVDEAAGRIVQLLRDPDLARRLGLALRHSRDWHAQAPQRLAQRLMRAAAAQLEQRRLALAGAEERLQAHDPHRVLQRGYAWVESADGRPVISALALRPGQAVRAVWADGRARAALHQHLMAMGRELAHAGRRQADTVFMVLDFLGYADEHCRSSS